MITNHRLEKFKRVAALRQEMTVIFENVHDPHNIGAVLRSCDSVGIQEVYILYTEDNLTIDKLKEIDSTATGVRKWMNVHVFRDAAACFKAVREKYDLILATHLNKEAKALHDLELTGKIAFLFGNEHAGISEESLKYSDHNFIIPQFGMAQSLNISVACAVTLYEALRQRMNSDMYTKDFENISESAQGLYAHYVAKHEERYQR